MSDKPPHTNGNGNGIIGAGVKLGNSIVNALTPQYLALIILNMLSLFLLYWFVDARAKHTVEVINRLLATCLQNK
jgi:low temperature requirement protein LtrA